MGILEGPDAGLARRALGLSIGSMYVASCGWLVPCLSELGLFEQALHYGDAGVREADAIEQPFTQAFARTQHAFGLIFKGEFARALPLCERAVRVCESGSVVLWLPPAYAAWGWALVWAGRSAEGVSYLERSVTLIEGLGTKLYLPRYYFWWAEGLLLADCVSQARVAAKKALALATELGERGNEGHALRLLGDIAAAGAPPDFLAAESFYERSRVLATELGMRPLVAHCHLGLGKLYRRTGKREQVQEHLIIAATMYREMDMRFWLEKADAEVRELA